ncbi:hypothetical protein CDG81_13025 [Actinopolyspora erythraea]|uniref:Uncharacterized protein n=1 Tax=Actinopolyspora erythraea TaxID=414996 RepID=A0A223RT46_9ACTN|nr:hypothetical protein [Actinopolyspora erythraea]ASU79055.1 hypothetical protein CDG81_13025 [Actinopolyspora erythraea]
MSENETTTTTNTAGSGSSVGIQAEQVHNSTVYMVSSDDPPAQKYQVGVNYLDNGVPLRARERIDEAIARDYDGAEVRFHWALALLSKRSYRELSTDERGLLGELPDHIATYPDSEWTRALEALCELIDPLAVPDRDPAPALEKLRSLPARQREKIVRHCDLVLTSGVKDSLWAETRRTAERGQRAGNRENRVWAYFQPEPISPRAQYPDPKGATPQHWLRAVLASALFVGSLGVLGWILLQRPAPISVIAYSVMVTGSVIGARTGFEWRYRKQRLQAKDREYSGDFVDQQEPETGFVKRVDNAFRYYAHKYPPRNVDRSVWLAKTRGIRRALRDEIVEIYRESRISVGRVTWLIRYLVIDVQKQWSADLLFSYRRQYRTPLSTRIWCLSALVAVALAACLVIEAAVRTDPLPALTSVLVAVTGGRVATLRWWRILGERRRFAEETRERARRMEAREAEYRRWKGKLEATCPTEKEMETWLEYDRALLIDEALRHYRLAWRDITAHAIVQTPAKSCKRARVNGGPWRYSKYELRLFLITTEGVRELARDLDVERGTFHGCERGHFRFDAVSSLRVVESGDYDYTLELTLTNGPTRTIEITEPARDFEPVSPDEPGLARISLDSAGFTHALHVLEGISAEGKAWIQRDTTTTQKIGSVPLDIESLV